MESELDGKCVFSGMVNLNPPFGGWNGFHAAHIFPLHGESWWSDQNYGRWIKGVTPGATPGVASINSRQNGFLLRAYIHAAFDEYMVSVDPDVSIIPLLIPVAYTHMETLGWL